MGCSSLRTHFSGSGFVATWARIWPRRAFATWTPENTAPAVLGARKGCSSHLATWALEGAARAHICASGAPKWAARASTQRPQSARKGCSSPRSVPPWPSKGLLGAPRALKGAALACSVSEDASSGCSTFWSVPQVRSERHFKSLSLSVSECCSRDLFSATSELCDTALWCTIHRAWICPGLH